MGINIKSRREIEIMRDANRIVAEVLITLKEIIEPGMDTEYLNKKAEEITEKHGAKPAFKGYMGYPKSLCVSINSEIVHGIPSKSKKIREGDIVSLDFGVIYKGYYGDAALTVAVGEVSDVARKLMKVTEESLYRGIEAAQPGNHLGDIGHAVQSYVEANGFNVVRDFVGHGIGKQLHEEPQVPNYGKPGEGVLLREGMTLAIEPMVTEGTWKVKVLEDGWTAVTADGKLAAHYEHTIAITSNGPEILSKL